MASPNFSEMVTTTLKNRSGKLNDNFTNNNMLIKRMNEKGNVDFVDGGETIVQELEYQQNSTYQRYAGYDTLNIQPSDTFTAAEFSWCQTAVAVTASGLEVDVKNTGAERVINLLASRIKNAEKTMMNNMSTDIYSAGTAAGAQQINGLQALVADTPTSGTVGGIDRATWTFWRNYYNTGGTPSATTIQGLMDTTYLSTSRGTDHPDLWIADNTYFKYYWQSLQTIQRITDSKLGEAGFTALKFMASDVVFDGGIGGACPANHMYALNTEYLKWRPHKNRNFVPLDRVNSINQDAFVKLTVWAGNMTLLNGELQGLIIA